MGVFLGVSLTNQDKILENNTDKDGKENEKSEKNKKDIFAKKVELNGSPKSVDKYVNKSFDIGSNIKDIYVLITVETNTQNESFANFNISNKLLKNNIMMNNKLKLKRAKIKINKDKNNKKIFL